LLARPCRAAARAKAFQMQASRAVNEAPCGEKNTELDARKAQHRKRFSGA
jgi:hypothetical protein